MNFLTTNTSLTCVFVYFCRTHMYKMANSVGEPNHYSYKKTETFWPTSHYLTTDPNPLLPLAKRDRVTKNFETQVIPRRQIPFRKRNSRGTFRSYKSETCKKSKSLVSLTYLPERRNTEPRYKEPTNDFLYLDNSKICLKTYIKAPCQITPLPLISPPPFYQAPASHP